MLCSVLIFDILLCIVVHLQLLFAQGKNVFLILMVVLILQIREGRKQSLPECLKKEFRLTMNTLRSVVTGDVYEVL
jgi:hypothetical protein